MLLFLIFFPKKKKKKKKKKNFRINMNTKTKNKFLFEEEPRNCFAKDANFYSYYDI
jgi:hypothetical protein